MPGGGRPLRYDWEDKRDICYKLYVEEKRSIPDIIKYFVKHFDIPATELPSEKSLARQFLKKWAFPPRREQLTEDVETYLGQRMSALWAKNMRIVDIRNVLKEEGHVLSNYDFSKLKTKYGINRRGQMAFTPLSKKSKRPRTVEGSDEVNETEEGTPDGVNDVTVNEHGIDEGRRVEKLPPDEAARRAQYAADIYDERKQDLQARKRRRRTRGHEHNPFDATDVTLRYGAETSLDECKAVLGLDNDRYATIRKQYNTICGDMNVDRKKTALEGGRWQESKDRLVRENMHLSAIMHPLQPDQDNKATALDLICADVCKRIRVVRTQLTIADANNVLGINPGDSKSLRHTFYEILKADHYTTRLACGKEHWQELRQEWFASSPFLQAVMAEGDAMKVKCVDLLCRDASKRYNDDMMRLDPNRRVHARIYQGPGPGAANHRGGKRRIGPIATASMLPVVPGVGVPESTVTAAMGSNDAARLIPQSSTKSTGIQSGTFADEPTNLAPYSSPIDPTLADTNFYAAFPPPFDFPMTSPTITRAPGPVPAYFRLSPHSQLVGAHPRMWLGKLTSPSIPALHAAATTKSGAATVKKIHGIIKNEDGTEDQYQIDNEDELTVYLETATEKATFVVCLVGGYA